MKKIFIAIYALITVSTLYGIFFLSTIHSPYTLDSGPNQTSYHKGVVLEALKTEYLVESSGKKIHIEKDDEHIYNSAITYKRGDTITLYAVQGIDGSVRYDIADYYHINGLIFLFIIVSIIVILVAKKRGFFAMVSAVLSLYLFYALFLSLIRIGIDPTIAGIIFALVITFLTIPLIHGFNKKSLSALISVNISYILGMLATFIALNLVHLSPTPGDDFRTLSAQFSNFPMSSLLIVSLFLGAAGALIDVAVSISSAIFSALEESKNTSFAQAYHLGLEVGKDILGSMMNTLLLAYLASSLPFFVTVSLDKFGNLAEIINYDFITLELTRSLMGAVTIVILVPIVSSISAYILAGGFTGKKQTAIER